MVAEIVALCTLLVSLVAEWIHWNRSRQVRYLVFGPTGRSSLLAFIAPALRVAAMALIAWGLITLMTVPPNSFLSETNDSKFQRHFVLLLDVSPSMRLVDAGPDLELSRMQRANDILKSFFDRVPIAQYRISVIAFYNTAIPVVIETQDMEVVNNIMSDLPMHFAFTGKQTNLFAGLKEAARVTQPFEPQSTILMILSDGDTVPEQGMPKLPNSIAGVVVVGVGDPVSGKFIDGKNSKQNMSALRQAATRMNGEFHNGNEKQIASSILTELTSRHVKRSWQSLTKRDFALLAFVSGAAILACLPILLHYFGSSWQVGTLSTKKGAG